MNAPGLDPLGHLPRRMDFLAAHVHNLGLSLPNKFADKMNSSVPRMVADAFEERMPKLLFDTLKNILPPLYKEFNALNKLESQRFVILEKKMKKSICKTVRKSVTKYVHNKIGEVNGILTQCAKHQMLLINYIEKILHSSVKVPRDILVVTTKHLQTKVDRTSDDLHELEEELAKIEAKRVQHMNKMRDEYNLCIKFRDDTLPITNFSYRINKSSKLAIMRITRNNQPLNLKVFDRFVLKMLGFTEWLELHTEKKRKIKAEVLHEVFVKEKNIVGGMQRNLSFPDGVVGKAGLAIKEPKNGIFCKMKSLIFIDELIYEIVSRPNVVQAREIVAKNLDGMD
ncbi:hypothetical protein Tco_0261173 [Tanacetum coccineum]